MMIVKALVSWLSIVSVMGIFTYLELKRETLRRAKEDDDPLSCRLSETNVCVH